MNNFTNNPQAFQYPFVCVESPEEVELLPTVTAVEGSPGSSGRKKRTWDLQLSNVLYSLTKSYCSEKGKLIETLGMEDFGEIAMEVDRSAEQCLVRIREIVASGSTSAGAWCRAEDELLMSALKDHMPWKEISVYLNSVIHSGVKVRTAKHCKERWNNHLNPDLLKGQWTPQEDLLLIMEFQLRKNRWSQIAKSFKHRNENTVKNRINSLLHKEKQLYGITNQDLAVERIIRRLRTD